MRIQLALGWVTVAFVIWLAAQHPQTAGDITTMAGHLLATAYRGFLRILGGI